jgi:hypothetical protein
LQTSISANDKDIIPIFGSIISFSTTMIYEYIIAKIELSKDAINKE